MEYTVDNLDVDLTWCSDICAEGDELMQQGILDWEDRDIFFDEFAVDATLEIRGSGDTLNLEGILDTPYQQRAFGAFVVDADDPSFTCKWVEELEDVRVGDKLTIGTEEFYLNSPARSDGTGMAKFHLDTRKHAG